MTPKKNTSWTKETKKRVSKWNNICNEINVNITKEFIRTLYGMQTKIVEKQEREGINPSK